jgi:dolichyl-diphosphooligosaccharide--protein glycosyltransferase
MPPHCIFTNFLICSVCYQALGVFGLCQLHSFVDYLRSHMSEKDFEVLFHAMLIATASITAVVGGALTLTGMV